MRNTFSKRIFAVLAAVLLGVALCAPLTFADEADTADTTDSTETVDTTEGTTDTAGEDSSGAESFFNELKADNGVGRTLFIAGAVCIVLGVGGIVSIILWQRASRNRDSGEADRAEVLDEIEQEERRNRRRREEERMRREQMQAHRETEPRVPTSFDPDKDTGELPVMPVAAEYTAECPIMPETPVSMQPQNVRRAAVQTSVNRAPRQFTPGEPGQYRSLELELKVLADVGLLGMPNAGKSTLITAVSNARPKIADYPFTTLHPHLGVVRVGPEQSFVLADVPGLIEGAAEGAGLGHLFLRHLSRTKVLLHVIDAAPLDDTVDPFEQAHALVAELEKYDPELAAKPRWVVLNKMDLVPEEERDALVEKFRSAFAREGEPVFAVSAATREGLTTLLNALAQKVDEDRRAERAFLDDERFDEERENAEPYDPAAH